MTRTSITEAIALATLLAGPVVTYAEPGTGSDPG
jgi:hypothetical protein